MRRSRPCLWAFVVGAISISPLLLATPASAFNPKSHIVIANRALAAMKNVSADKTKATITVPNVGDIVINNPEVVKAAQLCPEYFRGGAIGPDFFPDVVEGQLYTHANMGRDGSIGSESCTAKCIEARGIGPDCDWLDKDKGCYFSFLPLEQRPGDRWRSIDAGMYQLRKALDYKKSEPSTDPCSPHLQAIAFAYGYLSHMIGDSFAHSYINEWARSTFQLTSGRGMFGPVTEELQHYMLEYYMDSHVQANPDDLKVSWPTAFLTEIYTSKFSGSEVNASLGADAGTLGGPFFRYMVKLRDLLDTLSHREKWASAIGGKFGDINARLSRIIGWVSTFGTGVGDPLADMEDFFRRRKLIVETMLSQWSDLNGCVGQNVAQGAAQPLQTKLRTDRCAEINFEDNKEIADLFGESLNDAAHYGEKEGPDFNYGSIPSNLTKMFYYIITVVGRTFIIDPIDDIRSLRIIRDEVLKVCEDKGIAGNSTCTEWCEKANQTCHEVLNDVAYGICFNAGCTYSLGYKCDCYNLPIYLGGAVYCGVGLKDALCYGEAANPGCWPCFANSSNWVTDTVCTTTRDTFLPFCTFCTEHPLCKVYDGIEDLKAEIEAFIADILKPYMKEAKSEIGEALLEYYAGEKTEDFIKAWKDFGKNRAASTPAWLINLFFLKEDLSADPNYLNRLLQDFLGLSGPLVSNAGSVGQAVEETAEKTLHVAKTIIELYISVVDGQAEVELWKGLLTILYRMAREQSFQVFDDLESDAYAWLDHLSFKSTDETYETRFGNFLALVTQLNLITATRGITATSLHQDLKLGAEKPGERAPLDMDLVWMHHNSIELTKLGFLGGDDIAKLAGQPSASASPKSAICKSAPNIVCDSIQSLDDPNNYGHAALTDGRADWERSVVYWTSRDRVWQNGAVTQEACVTAPTDFILSDSRDKADRLYAKIFQYPDTCVTPRSLGFDDPTKPWTAGPPATVSQNPGTKTQGDGSLQVAGCGYMAIKSPEYNTTDFGFVGSSLALDIFIPQSQANPYWTGDVKMFVSIPTANINNSPLGWVGLTGLPKNQWNTITFTVPDTVRNAILGDYPRMTFTIEMQQVSCNAPAFLDNLRFVAPLTARTTFHTRGSSNLVVATNPLFSFENLSDWSGTGTTLRLEQAPRVTEGSSSLAASASSWVTITSRKFAASETPGATSKLNVDVWVPARLANDTSESWMHAYLSCPSANILNQYLGNKGLESLFYNEFNSVIFPLSAEQKSALSTPRSDCSVSLAFNATQGRGNFLFDKMGFVP